MYHVLSRGNRREKIFLDDVDRQDFLKTLAEACQKTDWQVHAYCLMPKLWEDAIKRYRAQMKNPAFVIGFAFGVMDQLGFGSFALVP